MKKVVMFGMIIGSTAGSYLPLVWGGNVFSMTSILLGVVGGFLGIWVGYRIAVNIF